MGQLPKSLQEAYDLASSGNIQDNPLFPVILIAFDIVDDSITDADEDDETVFRLWYLLGMLVSDVPNRRHSFMESLAETYEG